ncbi:MAG: hypothetical protein K0S80_3802 [Neobacillus sp.]|nr:hypothetical protein [Neobacillus sp.]
MNDLLGKLYQHFYTQPSNESLKRRIETNYQELIQHLNKEDAILVMHTMDDKDLMVTEVSMDSFIQGFQMGWMLIQQLSAYEGNSLDSINRDEITRK